jgi:hypothetical protein
MRAHGVHTFDAGSFEPRLLPACYSVPYIGLFVVMIRGIDGRNPGVEFHTPLLDYTVVMISSSGLRRHPGLKLLGLEDNGQPSLACSNVVDLTDDIVEPSERCRYYHHADRSSLCQRPAHFHIRFLPNQ